MHFENCFVAVNSVVIPFDGLDAAEVLASLSVEEKALSGFAMGTDRCESPFVVFFPGKPHLATLYHATVLRNRFTGRGFAARAPSRQRADEPGDRRKAQGGR